MNDVCLMGRLTAEPELKKTTSGKSVCGFRIAVERSFGEGTDFFNCISWSKTGEFVAKYFHKGNRIALTGRLQFRQWEQGEQTRSVVEVVAEQVFFADSKDNYKKQEEPEQISWESGDVPF